MKTSESHNQRVSKLPQHVLNDTARLIVRAGNNKLKPTDAGDYRFDAYNGLSTDETHALLTNAVAKATTASIDAPKAVECVRKKCRAEYYSGVRGMSRMLASRMTGQFDFERCDPRNSELDSLAATIATLPSPAPEKVEALPPNARPVFDTNLRNRALLGAIESFQYRRYDVVWMSPQKFLQSVDPDFTRHADEESMPGLLKTMRAIAMGERDELFAPLMMNPNRTFSTHQGGTRMEHEGRHRALAAILLGITRVPVAVAHLENRRKSGADFQSNLGGDRRAAGVPRAQKFGDGGSYFAR